MRRCPPRCAWLLLAPLSLPASGCGVAVMAYDTVRGWLGLDDDEGTAAPAEPASGGTDDGEGTGGDTAKTAAAHVEGGSTGKANAGEGSSGDGPSSDGADEAATSTGGSLPASFPPAATGSGSGADEDATGGTAAGSGTGGAADDDSGGTGGGTDESGDAGTDETGGPPTPSTSEAECLEGTWVADDLDTYLRHKIRTHARGRTVKIRSHSGAYELRFVAAGGGKGELTTTATSRVHRYETELAKVPVEYTVRLTGTATSSYEVTGPGRLRVDAPTTGRISGGLTVDIDGQKQAKRGVAMASDGDFELACVGDDLTLTPKSGTRLGQPLTFQRK